MAKEKIDSGEKSSQQADCGSQTRNRIFSTPRSIWIQYIRIPLLCTIFTLLFFNFLPAFAPRWLQHLLFTRSNASDKGIHVSQSSHTIILPIDHFNTSDTRTFENRYWLHDSHYQKGGPVFFYDAGEAGVQERGAANLLRNESTYFAPLELAQKYHGMVIIWEHRFYGNSTLFEVNQTTGLAIAGYEAYKYLTNEQALEDVVYFANHFSPSGYGDPPTAQRVPWIWIGGSYPGDRAAMIRVRNPDVFFASWASSAPVQFQIENPSYYSPIWQSMPGNCSADVHAAVMYADGILENGKEEEVELLKRAAFLTRDANPNHRARGRDNVAEKQAGDPGDFTYSEIGSCLAYVFQSTPIHFQWSGYNVSLGDFCNRLEAWNPVNFTGFTMESSVSELANNSEDGTITSEGIAATYGSEKAFYAFLHATIQKSISDSSTTRGKSRGPQDLMTWAWQLCSQFAQFQVSPYPSNTSMISRYLNITNSLGGFCQHIHPYVPDVPDIDSILKYGGWKMQPSNVMWTNGELDPWRSLGVHADTKINPEALNRPRTIDIPPCGVPPNQNEVFGLLYEGQVHVMDLIGHKELNMTGPLELGFRLFSKALDSWLPCFEPTL